MFKIYTCYKDERALVSEYADEWDAVKASRELRWEYGQSLPGIHFFVADFAMSTQTTFTAILETIDAENRSIALQKTAKLQK